MQQPNGLRRCDVQRGGHGISVADADRIRALKVRAAEQSVDVAIFMTDMCLGGVQRVIFNLCSGLVAAGLRVDLLVCKPGGEMAAQMPDGVHLVALEPGSKTLGRFAALLADPLAMPLIAKPVLLAAKPIGRLKFLRPVARYLKRNQPAALLAADTDCNLIAVWGRRLSGVNTRLVLSAHRSVAAHTALQLQASGIGRWRWRFLAPVIKRCYDQADAVVAVSSGVARELAEFSGLSVGALQIIYNPVVMQDFFERASQPLRDDWLRVGAHPLLLAAGRLDPQKDFATLLYALQLMRRGRQVHLVILGDGPQRSEILALAEKLGVADALHLPGYVDNPLPYMRVADVFIMSSRFEGLPTVLIEALACGCPVVSTDCPHGPREILDQGRFGELVAMQDPQALAAAVERTLDAPPQRQRLIERGRAFGYDAAVSAYLRVLAGG